MEDSILRQLRNEIERKKGQRDLIRRSISELKERIVKNTSRLHHHEQAREIIKEVALQTQQQLQVHISDLSSLALDAVYDEPYELAVEFVQRRNKTECDLYFMRDEERYDPIDDTGGGVVNVASFALRLASWNMQKPKSNNVLVLDEPFGNVSPDLLPRVSQMLQTISKQLNVQIIMISHSEDIINAADKTFTVNKRKNVSYVKEE
jgi:ABC-type transporter Mla maintaining outer membrane lipid asymmetry ATPase subunit MlaF